MTLVPVGGRGLERLKVNDPLQPCVGDVMNRSPPRTLPATGCVASACVCASSGRDRTWSVPGAGDFCASGTARPNSLASTVNGFWSRLTLNDAEMLVRNGLNFAVSLRVLP